MALVDSEGNQLYFGSYSLSQVIRLKKRYISSRDVQGGLFSAGRGKGKNPRDGAGWGGAKVKRIQMN